MFKASSLFSNVSLRSLCRGGCSFFPNASNKKVQSWLVGEKSRSLSRKRARRQETRADATERDSLPCRRGSFLRGGESMPLPKMVVRIIARVHRMLVPHVIENISNLLLLTTPNEDAISQTLVASHYKRASKTIHRRAHLCNFHRSSRRSTCSSSRV